MTALKRTSSAIWKGNGVSGNGTLDTQSGVFNSQPYSFKARFSDASGKSGTNPEELIAAAHAGCFTMAVAFILQEAGFIAEELKTNATVSIEQIEKQFRITKIDLMLQANIPNISNEKFQELTKLAKENCPVSVALSSVLIELKANLI